MQKIHQSCKKIEIWPVDADFFDLFRIDLFFPRKAVFSSMNFDNSWFLDFSPTVVLLINLTGDVIFIILDNNDFLRNEEQGEIYVTSFVRSTKSL